MWPSRAPGAPTRGRLGPVAKARLASEVVGSYFRVRRSIRREGIKQVVSSLRGGDAACEDPTPDEVLLGLRLGRAAGRTLRLLPGLDDRCLTRSLVTLDLLARRGVPGALVIGVSPSGSFAAHAWVELGDQPVLPAEHDRFGRLVEI